MMKFQICELKDVAKNCFKLEMTKDSLKRLKENVEFDGVMLDFDALNLGVKLYGNTKKESIEIQKKNAKVVLSVYKQLKKAVAVLKKKGSFDGMFYVENLSSKKNNNDIMLAGMLNVKFNSSCFHKMTDAVVVACDFLDAENALNNMCDFRDNKCTKKRELNKEGDLGCCPSFCKYRIKGPCPHQNLSCKIFMCDYLIYEKGYYFTPNTLAVLMMNLTVVERFLCFGNLCKPLKQSMKFLWRVRVLVSFGLVAILSLLALTVLGVM